MSSPEDFQKEFNTMRNKQVEVFDRLGQLEAQITQFNERPQTGRNRRQARKQFPTQNPLPAIAPRIELRLTRDCKHAATRDGKSTETPRAPTV
jgi:hypothetical protein